MNQKSVLESLQEEIYETKIKLNNLNEMYKKQLEIVQKECGEKEGGHQMFREDSGDCNSSYYYKVCKKCGWWTR